MCDRKKLAKHSLRVNIKSLAAESRIIRQEIEKAQDKAVTNSLYFHRIRRLKPEARLAQLALAFVKGTPYKVVERNARKLPPVKDLEKKLKKFCPVSREQILTWLNA